MQPGDFYSNKEWNYSFSALGVVGKFLLVSSVLFDSPNSHLVKGCGQENVATKYLSLDHEGEPGASLPQVVG